VVSDDDESAAVDNLTLSPIQPRSPVTASA
jgi:hypothetical protein